MSSTLGAGKRYHKRSKTEELDHSEYETKSDAEVAESLGLAHLPEADQSDKEPIPELVDRRTGEGLAGYEKRVGEEADHTRLANETRAIVESSETTTAEASTEEPTFETTKYTAAWVTDNSRPDEVDERQDELPDNVPPKATVTIKEINDNRYYYWQWREDDKVISKYKGPVNPDE
ncbi:hypothetical protein SG26_19675 (plasmid) [Haloarcula sp. CBA1115]|nr:hypothetical protein SG26_19675 [Haloarcula sp. CBA1115]